MVSYLEVSQRQLDIADEPLGGVLRLRVSCKSEKEKDVNENQTYASLSSVSPMRLSVEPVFLARRILLLGEEAGGDGAAFPSKNPLPLLLTGLRVALWWPNSASLKEWAREAMRLFMASEAKRAVGSSGKGEKWN